MFKSAAVPCCMCMKNYSKKHSCGFALKLPKPRPHREMCVCVCVSWSTSCESHGTIFLPINCLIILGKPHLLSLDKDISKFSFFSRFQQNELLVSGERKTFGIPWWWHELLANQIQLNSWGNSVNNMFTQYHKNWYWNMNICWFSYGLLS